MEFEKMGYPCNGVFVILLFLVISDHNLVSSFELEDLSNNEQLDSTASPISKENSSILITEKPKQNLEKNTLNNQNETKFPLKEIFPFMKLKFKPVFHIKRVENNNDDTENNTEIPKKNEIPRFVPCNNVPHLIDINKRWIPARPVIHRRIILKLVNPRRIALPRPNHNKPISSVDPALGLLDHMMHDLMVPLFNDMPLLDNINTRRLDNREDSSLKFWMQNENRNKPNPWHIRETSFEANDENDSREYLGNDSSDENDSSEDLGNNSSDDKDVDYKSDLWKKFIKDDENKQDDSVSDYSSDSKQNSIQLSNEKTEHATLDSKPFVSKCQNYKSFDAKMNENIVKEDETEWWTRLVLPWKRPIYKDHKKSSRQETRMRVGDGETLDEDEDEDRSMTRFNTKAVGLRGNEELPLKYKINMKYSNPIEGDSHTPTGDNHTPTGDNHTPTGDSHTPTRRKHMHRHVNYDTIMILFGFGIVIVLVYKIMQFLFKIRAHNIATTSRSPYLFPERKLRVPLPSYFLPSSYYATAPRTIPPWTRQDIPSAPRQDIPPMPPRV